MGGTDNVQVPDRGKEKADAGQGSLTANAVQAEWRLTCGASPYHEAGSCDTASGDGQASALPVLHAILVMPTPA